MPSCARAPTDYNILSHLKHGFRSRHSCKSQLIATLHDLLRHYGITSPPFWQRLSVIQHHKIRSRPEDPTTRPKTAGSLGLYLGDVVQSIEVCYHDHRQSGKKEAAQTVHHGRSVVLSHVQEAKYIGILISDDLSWTKHTQVLSSKANGIIGWLHRNLHHTAQCS